jgi:hypothetical protein
MAMGEGARRPGDRSDISSDDDGESPCIKYFRSTRVHFCIKHHILVLVCMCMRMFYHHIYVTICVHCSVLVMWLKRLHNQHTSCINADDVIYVLHFVIVLC